MPTGNLRGVHERALFVIVVVALLCGCSARARAQVLSAAVLVGYASSTSNTPRDIEPYGVGLGASAGLTLPVLPIYFGARITSFMGETQELSAGGLTASWQSRYLLYGIDIGYEWELAPLVVRPALGIGRATVENSGSAIDGSDAATRFVVLQAWRASRPIEDAQKHSLYLAPAVTLLFATNRLCLGIELSYGALIEHVHSDSVGLHATIGVRI